MTVFCDNNEYLDCRNCRQPIFEDEISSSYPGLCKRCQNISAAKAGDGLRDFVDVINDHDLTVDEADQDSKLRFY